MKKRSFTLPIFNVDVMVLWEASHEEVLSTFKKFDPKVEMQDEYDGLCFFYNPQVVIVIENKSIGIVAHEASHAAMYILDHHSVPTDVDNLEIVGMLTGYIAGRICEFIGVEHFTP